MLTDRHVRDLLALIRRRYPTWDGFTHPDFVADELVYKRAAVAKAQEWLSLAACDSLVAAGDSEEFLARVERLAQENNLLWRRVPSAADTAVLHHPALDKPTFCTQLRNLLYADRPSPARLQTFSDYLQTHGLPNKWPFPTYFLFLCHPQQELLVRSDPITWFLQFMGAPQKVRGVPEAAVYTVILQQAKRLLHTLLPFGAEDMVDVQSFIWVCAKEGEGRIGRLRPKAQVELDIPAVDTLSPVVYSIPAETTFMRETNAEYTTPMNIPSHNSLLRPVFLAIKQLDNANSHEKIVDTVAKNLNLSVEQQNQKHKQSKQTELSYRITWVKTWLKIYGVLRKIGYGQWELTDLGKQLDDIDPADVHRVVALHHSPLKISESFSQDENEFPEVEEEGTPITPGVSPNPVYGLAELVHDTGFPETEISRWLRAIERKGQAVFYGPPGTGKTFVAQKVAQHLMSEQDGFVDLVQFHPAYAYEDFMQGLRPVSGANGSLSYPLIPGRFLEFCARARTRTGICVLIIDEINRANLSTVFGELMYLLEYRQQEIPLSGGGRFSIPPNVRILGTMNTADRSIALVDHALRRRFAFIHLPPNYELLRHFLAANSFDPAGLIHLLQHLNRQIGDPHYAVGHTFFLRPALASELEDIWRMEIEPYLEEYFFNQSDQVAAFRWETVSKEV